MANVPKCIICNAMLPKEWQEGPLVAPHKCVIMSLIDRRLDIAIGIADGEEFGNLLVGIVADS